MAFIDGCVAAAKTADKDAYTDFAKAMGAVFREYGATGVVDAWGVDVPEGKLTSFPMAVKAEPGETVIFSWVTWPSKEVRDEAWPKIMADPRMSPENGEMPMDGKRMIFGGFEVIAEA